MTTRPPGATTPARPTRYSSMSDLVHAVGDRIAADLSAAVSARGAATLIVSGGHSPVPLFEYLRTLELDWQRVQVGLADERWVDVADAASNERLVREVLLRERAAPAGFRGLKNGAPSAREGAAEASRRHGALPRPYDVVLLGMGEDGHTASLFPDSPELRAGLDLSIAPACLATQSPSPPTERLSLNLSALLDSQRIVVLLSGESKWRTYGEADKPGPVERMPVRAVLRQMLIPVEVAWAP